MTQMLTTSRRRRLGFAAVLTLAAATALALTAPIGSAQAGVPNGAAQGIMCEAGDNGTFNLNAASGYITTPDGNSIYSWGYTAAGRAFQLPGPTLCVDQGQRVTVILHNTLREDTSIIFSGQTGVTADGQPAVPVFDGTNKLTSLVKPAAGAVTTSGGGSVTYQFTAGAPGSYLYASGTDVRKQRDMGLYGALVVYPPNDHSHANGLGTSAFDTGHEYLYVLSQVDPDLHAAVERNRAYNYVSGKGRYFFINGRSMPDTLAPNNAAWMPSQPYGALVHIGPHAAGAPALIRYVNAGPVNYPFHPHGSDQTVITRDGQPVSTYNKFLIDVGPGQSVDTQLIWSNQYDPNGSAAGTSCSQDQVAAGHCAAIPSDIQLPQLQDQIVGPGTESWFSENPYLGGALGQIPTGMVQNNQCGEYYHVAHSHALEQSTNYGASFGGMMTLIRIDPPTGCPAP